MTTTRLLSKVTRRGVALLFPIALAAQAPDAWAPLLRPRTETPRPTSAGITIADLRTRLFQFADDSMKGRLLDSPGNVKGAEYIAAEAKRLGLEPAGENGTYFQTVPVVQRTPDPDARLTVNGRAFEAFRDFLPRDMGAGARPLAGVPSIYGGIWGDEATMVPAADAAGKLVIIVAQPTDSGGGFAGVPSRVAVLQRFASAAGIAVIGFDRLPPSQIAFFRSTSTGMKDERPVAGPSYLYITEAVARALLDADFAQVKPGTPGRAFANDLAFVETPISNPARNVVAILRGSDPALKAEYVAIGAHNDHIGTTRTPVAHDSMYVLNHLFKPAGVESNDPKLEPADAARLNAAIAEIRRRTHGASARLDSVFNGADDDGTGSMSVLELAEYFAGQRTRPKRSLLFVWHVGEEEGMYGSGYFTDHPTVPRAAIVTQLNIDMIGRGGAADQTGTTKDGKAIRGGPDYLQLVGSRRNSTELGDFVETVNRSGGHHFTFDYSLDANGHPQNIYCRSDHYSYARYGIPVVFFTTGGHADYHQVTDEPQYIDYAHMLRVVNLVRDIATRLANLDHRVAFDGPTPDPRGACRQ